MMFLLSVISYAWPCATLLTTNQGALATSAAQQVILEANGAGTQTRYQIEHTGDTSAFNPDVPLDNPWRCLVASLKNSV
jgi:hypothetical protein